MRFQGAVVREQGVTFVVIAVKSQVVDDHLQASSTINSLQPLFSGLPIILMAQDSFGRPIYYGRRDIARFLAGLPLSAIPWREYTVN